MRHARRAYNTAWAAARRAAELAAANANRVTCAGVLAKGRPCNTRLESRFVNGHTVPFCRAHDRKARGVCVTCGERPVAGTRGRALYCDLCQRVAKQSTYNAYRKRNRTRVAKRDRARLKDPVKHAAKLEYKRLYRQARPGKILAHKREDYARNRERYLEYHRQYRAKKRAERAATELARYHGELPPRACLYCPTVLTGRPKICAECKSARRQSARTAIASRIGVAA